MGQPTSRRRRHAAASARILSAGFSSAAAFGMVAGMAVSAGADKQPGAVLATPTAAGKAPTSAATPAAWATGPAAGTTPGPLLTAPPSRPAPAPPATRPRVARRPVTRTRAS
jgi:hypothetical protein